MQHPPGLDLARLRGFMEREMPGPPAGPLRGELISGGRSNLTYKVTDGVGVWVVRRPPRGEVLQSAHDVGREFRVLTALAGSDVPVPAVGALCSDVSVIGAPFYVMDYVEGIVIRSTAQFATLDSSVRVAVARDLVDVLADLHCTSPSDVGLEALGRPDGYLERQIARWARQYREIAVRDLPLMQLLSDKLAGSIPPSQRAAIVHGDYRLDNVLVAPGSSAARPIRAVLDWELATLGDPLADLGNLIGCWDEEGQPFHPITDGLMALPGLPSRQWALDNYAERTGLNVDQIEWYVAFSLFKLAVILEQIYARDIRGETIGNAADGVGDLALGVLERAAAIRA